MTTDDVVVDVSQDWVQRDGILRSLRQGDAHATVRECRTHSAGCSSAERFNRYARDGRSTNWNVS